MFKRPFNAYTYSYPHKTAYRALVPALSLNELWQNENVESLFLYLHIPFCEFRCGFCNLFTHVQPKKDLPTQYLAALRRQAESVRAAIPNGKFEQMAIGGGTPTYLNNEELIELFDIITNVLGVEPRAIPVSFEASPATIDEEKLQLLKNFGVDRLSMGVQSFNHREAHAIGRPEKADQVRQALDLLGRFNFETLNIDLIYGGENQTNQQWLSSVDEAISYRPEEIFLYPLYVRQLTGLDRVGRLSELSDAQQQSWDDQRLEAYRAARDRLTACGYSQKSLRMFRRSDHVSAEDTIYRCQSDGMIGLGSGARSYTQSLHYSSEYAVDSKAVLGIIHDYIRRDTSSFAFADYGFQLDEEDQRRRFAIMSLLPIEGLSRSEYLSEFGTEVLNDLPELNELPVHGLAVIDEQRIVLTPEGIEMSDAIGPWLYSQAVNERMESYECK
ncbi:MAG: STM4012 family radical SAM protein [Mariniblastus sp.]